MIVRRFSKPKIKSNFSPEQILIEKQSREINSLREKLMVLSKGYYEIRTKLENSENQKVELQKTINLHDNSKENFEKEFDEERQTLENEKEELKRRLSELNGIQSFEEENEKLKKMYLSEVEGRKKDNRRYRSKIYSLRSARKKILGEKKKVKEDLQEIREKMEQSTIEFENTISLMERGKRKKRKTFVNLTMKVGKLNTNLKESDAQKITMKKEIATLKKRVGQYKKYITEMEIENSKRLREIKTMENKNFSLQTSVNKAYKIAREREAYVNELQNKIRYLRHELMKRDGEREMKALNSSLEFNNDENEMVNSLRESVNRISMELNIK